jgi:hypothetical protein
MTRIDRRPEILEAIAQLARLSAEGEYDQLIVRMVTGRTLSGMGSCKIVKGVVEPLYMIFGREVDEFNRELSREIRRRTGRTTPIQYTLIVDKYGMASAHFRAFSLQDDDFLQSDYSGSQRRHSSKKRSTSRQSQIWRLHLPKAPRWSPYVLASIRPLSFVWASW